MLTQITPPVARVAVLSNLETNSEAMLRGIEVAAQSLTLSVRPAPCRDDAEIEAAMAGPAREERGWLLVLPENFASAHRDVIVTLAARHHLPAVYPHRFLPRPAG
jgi:putative ABC transport system substrate-binding protein